MLRLEDGAVGAGFQCFFNSLVCKYLHVTDGVGAVELVEEELASGQEDATTPNPHMEGSPVEEKVRNGSFVTFTGEFLGH